ncbi:hypothetical protein PILCRDRAFT_816902 [Piloderma croceum F 1598]|uniref:Crinkler effector protein N-terminal domain-containing protein n=1 Tax=Piloderma croceum (strain F 1598) TaxID=765440 RepID=A0A0C3G4Z6_PILCF|nr:hypothetical protein PILCRDRAFT_816902 [Piloderma croceum F 1598]
MSDKIKLLCWVQGDKLDRGFPVRIKPSDIVADLKKAIQAEKLSFQKIDADSLRLWRSQLSMESINDDNAHSIKLEDGDILSVILPRPAGTTITPTSSIEDKLSDESNGIFQDQHPAKRRRSGGEMVNVIPEVFIRLWTTFLGKLATDCFVEEAVKIPDSRTLGAPNDDMKFTYLKLPDDITFPCGFK